jgi:SWI/SNF-related matrix-associated actin-dependent regulator of chromatin subfamily A-like protein 1
MESSLFRHQEDGVRWLSSLHTRGIWRAGLHDDMGLGKTAQAIVALDQLGLKRGIVVTNTTVKEHWRREFLRWSRIPRRYRKAADLTDINTFLSYFADVLIIGHEMLARQHKHLMRRLGILEFVLIDEAHKAKNPDAKRTIALKGKDSNGRGGICQFAQHTWELTGTPIPNDPNDLFTFLKFCGAVKGDLHDFTVKYMDSQEGAFSSRQTVKKEMVKELRGLVETYSLRRTGGIDLPPVFLTQTFLDGDARNVAQFIKDHPGIDRAILRALDGGNLNLIDHAQIMTLRRLIGEAKALPFAHYLHDLMKGGLQAPLVFGWHKNVLTLVQDFLMAKGYKVGRIDGDKSEKQKQTAMDRFQKGEDDALVANIQAGGEGITLTRAKHLFMLESGWTPKDNAQPIKRIHRIGQTAKTRAEFITLAGSYDEVVVDIVRRKVQAIFDANGQQMLAVPA